MTSLFHLLQALTVVAITSHGPVYAPHIQRLGGEAHLRRMEANIQVAAELADVPPHVLAMLIWGESRLSPSARSRLGALGPTQLLPGTPMFREWRAVCRLDPESCTAANIIIGARFLKRCWQVCGSGYGAAIARYRGLGCHPRRQEVRLAATARAWSKR